MIVRWSTRARADIARIKVYIADHDVLAAGRVVDRLLAVADLLTDNPRLGEAIGPNRYKFSRPPHVVIYRFDRSGITITRIYDARQNWRT